MSNKVDTHTPHYLQAYTHAHRTSLSGKLRILSLALSVTLSPRISCIFLSSNCVCIHLRFIPLLCLSFALNASPIPSPPLPQQSHLFIYASVLWIVVFFIELNGFIGSYHRRRRRHRHRHLHRPPS